jgi:phenylacetate-CoA ligase
MSTTALKNINLGTTANGIRNAFIKRVLSPYTHYKRFLDLSQWWPADRLADYQLSQLHATVRNAYMHVPYYRGIMEVFGLNPHDIRSLDDIAVMPILEKEDIRRYHREMVSGVKTFPIFYKCHTSGTTGKPLTLYRDLQNVGFEHALLARQWQWAGLGPHDRYATLKGEIISPRNTAKGEYWNFSIAENKLVMSSYHLSEQTFRHYLTAMQKYNIFSLEGYPSSVYALARFMLEQDIQWPMKAVLTTSETLAQKQKSVIENAFACQVFDYYGMAERVAAIHTCEQGCYHLVPEYSLVELVKTEHVGDGCFEIVGTALNNRAMPLIRYRVGDIAKPSQEACSCGRAYPVIKSIIGRKDDYIVTPSGKLVGRLDHIFKGARNLVEAQLYQPDKDRVVLRIVPDKGYRRKDGQDILQKLQQRLGERMLLEIENVASIPRNGRGKFKAVISNVNSFPA